MRRLWALPPIFALFVAACTAEPAVPSSTHTQPSVVTTSPTTSTTSTSAAGEAAADPPRTPAGPLDPALVENIEKLIASLDARPDRQAIVQIGESGDPRIAWLLADFLRFVQFGPDADAALAGFELLTGASIGDGSSGAAWVEASNLLIAWNLPAPPGYLDFKRRLFVLAEERWEPFFEAAAPIDWRLVSWGGVFIDDRPDGDAGRCSRGCIPALDDPAVTPAEEGSWYPDGSLVFGIVVDDEARAYPKNMMEVHEMVNDTLGGRRLGIPYCTLCGSAQAYFTDQVSEGVESVLLRTSGLLIRSNKMMFDLNTYSLIDTFRGIALSGPLADQAVRLEQVSVVTSTWGDWKLAHPETTILAEDGGIGWTYAQDPLGGRDAGGPIFPIGEVDPRLPVHTQVLGAEAPDGRPVAFPADQAGAVLDAGGTVELAGVRLERDGSGLRAATLDGEPLVSHQSFWFAWSQFHPGTLLWSAGFDE